MMQYGKTSSGVQRIEKFKSHLAHIRANLGVFSFLFSFSKGLQTCCGKQENKLMRLDTNSTKSTAQKLE
jgi:hypothetical protein